MIMWSLLVMWHIWSGDQSSHVTCLVTWSMWSCDWFGHVISVVMWLIGLVIIVVIGVFELCLLTPYMVCLCSVVFSRKARLPAPLSGSSPPLIQAHPPQPQIAPTSIGVILYRYYNSNHHRSLSLSEIKGRVKLCVKPCSMRFYSWFKSLG